MHTMGLLIAPQFRRLVLQFTLVNKRVASVCLQVKDRSFTVILAYVRIVVQILFGIPGTGAGWCSDTPFLNKFYRLELEKL